MSALTCPLTYGWGGLVQVSIPTGLVDSGPVGVSLLAKQGSDHLLLHTTSALYRTIQEETNVASVIPGNI